MKHLFEQYQLDDFLIAALKKFNITNPTPVQQQAIPAVLQGRDIVAQSQTGTGKTLAYLLPVIQQINQGKRELQGLILAPTRELASQIAATAQELMAGTEMETQLIQGGVDINRQIQRLKRNPQLIVGTTGRVLDLINENKLSSHTAKFLVIDEADTMLEMGFKDDIEKIIRKMKRNIQLMLFSATLPPKVVAMAKAVLKQPYHIEINPGERVIETISNIFFKVRAGGKEEALLNLIRLYNPYLGIVFTKTKDQVDKLVTYLRQGEVMAEGLHGDLQPGQRKQVMRRFREAKSQILVATDIAARGLDVEGITHIFNFDLPVSVDQYVHRNGRTGRAGESGIAVTLILAADEAKLLSLEKKLNLTFEEKVIANGEVVAKPRVGKKRVEVEAKTSAKPTAKPAFMTIGAVKRRKR